MVEFSSRLVGRVAKRRTRTFHLIAALAPLCALTACSESGGDAPATQPPPAQSSPPPPPPVDAVTQSEASRLLSQATFGPTSAEIDAVVSMGMEDWLFSEFAKPPTLHLDDLLALFPNGEFLDADGDPLPELVFAPGDSFWRAAISGDDQLRQRMAFALSQLLVVSDRNDLIGFAPQILAAYMDILTEGAFGNYRDLLEAVTYSVAMAEYLTYLQNAKGDPATGRVPDENYARELLQLFTIGLVALNPDGTPQAGAGGEPIELFDNDDITGLARVFTGLSFLGGNFTPRLDQIPPEALYSPLTIYPAFHSDLEKSFLGATIPANTNGADSIDAALDTLFNHPNLPPFISRQLIQRFVTSSPGPDYVARVSAAFSSGAFTLPDGRIAGSGERGCLQATIAAILFDEDARNAATLNDASFGKVREPVLRFTHWARAFQASNPEPSNEILLRNTSLPQLLSQHPYRSPSVFNFYRPGYIAPGTATGDAGLTAPELQIVNASSIVGYANFVTLYIFGESPKVDGTAPVSFVADYTAETALAETPEALVDHLDLLLTHLTMTDETRTRIIDALNQVEIDPNDRDGSLEFRARLAVLMAMTSADYLVQQ